METILNTTETSPALRRLFSELVDGAPIAAHAPHLRYGLSLMNQWVAEVRRVAVDDLAIW